MTRNLAICIAIISIFAALALAPATPAQAFDTVYVTRHADKQDPAPYRAAGHDELTPLSRRGMERAEALALLLAGADIRAVYAGTTTRALATAVPLAQRLGLTVSTDRSLYDAHGLAGFLAAVKGSKGRAGAALIVAHGHTLVAILTVLTGAGPGAIPLDYGRLFVLERDEKGNFNLARRLDY